MEHLPNHYLKIDCEQQDGEPILCATLMERPPEFGWETQGHYFRSQPGAIHWTLSAEPWEYDEACRCAVTSTRTGKHFDRLIKTMVVEEIGRARGHVYYVDPGNCSKNASDKNTGGSSDPLLTLGELKRRLEVKVTPISRRHRSHAGPT